MTRQARFSLTGLLGAFALLVLSACGSEAPTETADVQLDAHTIYLVRHAEKQSGDDPSLTEDGVVRAELLAEILADKDISHIHSTDYARTRQTAAPLASRIGLDVALYDPRNLTRFAETLSATPGVHLVVGHSNTTPALTEALGGDGGTPIYEPTEYDRLYIVELANDGSVKSRIERFGERFDDAVAESVVSAPKQGRGS